MNEYAKRGRAVTGLVILILAALIIIAAVFLYASGQGMYEQFVARPSLTLEDDPMQGRTFSEERVEWRSRYNGGEWTLTTPDGLTLKGTHTLAPEESHAWILLVSGIQGRSMVLEDFIIELHNRGYQVLHADLRGHGQSGGDALGLGVSDKQDLLSWVRQIEKQDPDARIVLYGFSMGGASVLMTSPAVPPSVTGIVSDSSFSSYDKELSYLLKQNNQPAFPLLLAGSLACFRHEGFWFGDSAPEKAVAESKVPLLLFHGEADDFVPVSMAKDLYRAAAGEEPKESGVSGSKTLVTVPGAGHCRSMDLNPALYWEALDSFLGLRLARYK